MGKKIKIGFLPLTKVNWTNEAMQKQRRDALAMLSGIDNAEIVGGDEMIDVEPKAMEVLEQFEKSRPDMIVALFATFSLGTIVSLLFRLCYGLFRSLIRLAEGFRQIRFAQRI